MGKVRMKQESYESDRHGYGEDDRVKIHFFGLDNGKMKRKEGVCVLAKVEGSEKKFWMSCV